MRFNNLFLFILIIAFLSSCTTSIKSVATDDLSTLEARLQQFIQCTNAADENCLLELYAKDYQSFSPVHKPQRIEDFIQTSVSNIKKHDFEVSISIKEIKAGATLGYVTMNWQLKSRDETNSNAPFANVQRIDIWKKHPKKGWQLFRTTIYNENTY